MQHTQKWFVHNKAADFNRIGEMLSLDPVTIRIARNRGIEKDEEFRDYFYPDLSKLHAPELLKDADKAVSILLSKIEQNKKIMIIGDYDIDGVCSTVILLKGLRECGGICDFMVPHRIEDGYGLNMNLVDKAIEQGADTILTCDNGIAAFDEIAYARERGLTVIVTDHHEVPLIWNGDTSTERLPLADAVVDPKQRECNYPFGGICGAVVAWKIVTLLMKKLGKTESSWMQYLELAAFATIGDVMELRDENRTIVTYGLKALSNTNNPGLRALISQSDLKGKTIKSYHIGFILGPCLNATGRLDSASRGVELLMTEDIEDAIPIAMELVDLNTSRKDMTMKGVELAKSLIQDSDIKNDDVLVIYLPDVHESLAGIIAGRIREEYYKPTFVLTNGEGCVKGSGRSTDAFSMYEQMSKIGDVFIKFGGHPKAAGLSIEEARVEEFRRRINENTGITDDDKIEKIHIDVPMPLEYITEQLVNEFDRIEPCGNGNEKPLFAIKDAKAKRIRRIGRENQFVKVTIVMNNGLYMDATYFGDGEEFISYYEEKYSKAAVNALLTGKESDVRFSLLYYPDINEYRGEKSVQITIKGYQ